MHQLLIINSSPKFCKLSMVKIQAEYEPRATLFQTQYLWNDVGKFLLVWVLIVWEWEVEMVSLIQVWTFGQLPAKVPVVIFCVRLTASAWIPHPHSASAWNQTSLRTVDFLQSLLFTHKICKNPVCSENNKKTSNFNYK